VSAIRPILVFTYRAEGWHIENLGNGPALDLIIDCLANQSPRTFDYRRLAKVQPSVCVLGDVTTSTSSSPLIAMQTGGHIRRARAVTFPQLLAKPKPRGLQLRAPSTQSRFKSGGNCETARSDAALAIVHEIAGG
jgi:hypothetical protein